MIMMHKHAMLALAAATMTLGLTACSTTGGIVSDFDREQNFASYQTFSWADDNPMTVIGARVIPQDARTARRQCDPRAA